MKLLKAFTPEGLFLIFFILASIAFGDPKPSLLFVHGSPGDKTQFDGYMNDPVLRTYWNLYAYDLPGFGDKSSADSLYSFSDQVNSILRHVQELPGKITLIGYSYGAPIVLRVAEVIPEKIENLVLISGVYNPRTVQTSWYLKISRLPMSQYYSPRSWRQSHHDTLGLSRALETTLQNLNRITAPVFIIHGTDDQYIPTDDLRLLSSLNPVSYIRPGIKHNSISSDFNFIQSFLLQLAMKGVR